MEHSFNPVDWYPWGEEAFRKAKAEDKPVFLSVGYSSCHWCHRMREESFEDPRVAQMMNDAFVNVKVDREERPDIDLVYMSVSQMMTGSGGWPLTIIMTPDKKPFMAATYIPKQDAFGRMGLLQLIPKVKQMWREERGELLYTGNQMAEALHPSAVANVPGDPQEVVFKLAFGELNERFDKEDGGFGDAPKFPTLHNYMFLLRYWLRTGDARALAMVERSLSSMRSGGIHDQLGHGFHRYSTDRRWRVPHFEKMLYDQAMTIMAYAEAFQATRKAEFAEVVEETVEYLVCRMKSGAGGFCSSEDADSEGSEGRFYLWTSDEFRSCLGEPDAELFGKVFGIEESGNLHGGGDSGMAGMNVLEMRRPASEWVAELGMSTEAFLSRLEEARSKLLAARERRERPKVDGKVLADWNGLLMAALAKASRVLGRQDYADEGSEIADLILSKMIRDGRLLHTAGGGAAERGTLDDYSFVIWGLLELYEATFDAGLLKASVSLAKDMIAHFGGSSSGAFFFTADDSEEVLARQMTLYDGAIPSGNSVASYVLFRLGRITSDASLEDVALDIVKAAYDAVERAPSGYTMLLCALDYYFGPSSEIVLAGVKGRPDTSEMLQRVNGPYLPNAVVLLHDPDDGSLEEVAPFLSAMTPVGGKAAAYVCQSRACHLPTTDPEALSAGIKALSRAADERA